MSYIVGQSKLLQIINNYTFQTLPKALLFLGPSGSGKHTIAKYIQERFNLNFIEIDEKVNADILSDYIYSTINTLYLINLNNFTEKQQNQFLKFIEEPSNSVFIVLIADSEAGILPTILNRCIKYHLEEYTQTEIEKIIKSKVNPLAFKIFKTPGKLMNLSNEGFKNVLELAEKVIHKLSQASYANTLFITTKINYKDLYNKIDFDLFFDAVEYLSLEDFKNNNNRQSLDIFKITNQFKQLSSKQNLIKETLMLNYLTTLWEATHDASRT
jgi:replication-associated recombination protein RarA